MESLFDRDLTYFPKGPRTETDSQGRFKLTHSLKEPYVVTARAVHFSGDRTERYRWIIPSSAIAGGRLLLSSDNVRR
jgi:hypothetical protein